MRELGGKYIKEPTQQTSHVLVCNEEALESEKTQWAQEINRRKKEQGRPADEVIQIVWIEWLWDCREWKGAYFSPSVHSVG